MEKTELSDRAFIDLSARLWAMPEEELELNAACLTDYGIVTAESFKKREKQYRSIDEPWES